MHRSRFGEKRKTAGARVAVSSSARTRRGHAEPRQNGLAARAGQITRRHQAHVGFDSPRSICCTFSKATVLSRTISCIASRNPVMSAWSRSRRAGAQISLMNRCALTKVISTVGCPIGSVRRKDITMEVSCPAAPFARLPARPMQDPKVSALRQSLPEANYSTFDEVLRQGGQSCGRYRLGT
jgi:hypothetical protein